MTAIENFGNGVANWLYDNGFEDVSITFDQGFYYQIQEKTIAFGWKSYPQVAEWFEHYLFDLGLEYTDIYVPVLCFLHELGHHCTLSNFSNEELCHFAFLKEITGPDEGTRADVEDCMIAYWNISDERAANEWAVSFINENIDAVCDLMQVFSDFWNDIDFTPYM